MDQLLIQRTRYLLRARFRNSQTCPDAMFIHSIKQLKSWIVNHPLLGNIAKELLKVEGTHHDQIARILAEAPKTNSYTPGEYEAISNSQHASICFLILDALAELSELDRNKKEFVTCCFGEYLNNDPRIKYEEAVTVLRDVAINGVYEYLDERLDERNAIYLILLKYKQRSEWFRKSQLIRYASEGHEGKKGEKALALDVQEYVLDQGVEFFVEPASASGEADLVLRTSEGRYLIIDAKYVRNASTQSKIRNIISHGFHQVARYCSDYNVTDGFLVNFIADTVRIRLGIDTIDGFPYLKIGGKNIYFIEINIADELSASKSGKAQEIEISKDELISTVKTKEED